MSQDIERWTLGGYAPGSYMCICLSCNKAHEADKRATQCIDCAAHEAATLITTLTAEQDSWKAACMEAREGCNQRSSTIRSLRSHLEASQALVQSMREALEQIAGHTDPDDPESYRSDDREGCLDTVQSIARAALSRSEV